MQRLRQKINNMIFAHDQRHTDFIQHMGFYGTDEDLTPFYYLSQPNFKLKIECKHIRAGFNPYVLNHYHVNMLKEEAKQDIPVYLLYWAPGELPTDDLKSFYKGLEFLCKSKLTSYSNWSFMLIALNKPAAEHIGNKKAKQFTCQDFYVWMSSVFNNPMDQEYMQTLDNKHSPQFTDFVNNVKNHFKSNK